MNALLAAFGGLQTLADAPASVVFVLKITAILSAAWLAHLALAWVNPRWRVLLWRATAVGLVALPAISWVLPALEIHVPQPPVEEVAVVTAAPAAPAAERPGEHALAQPVAGESSPVKVSSHRAEDLAPFLVPEQPVEWPAEASPLPQTAQTEVPPPTTPESPAVSWPMVLLAVWLAGVGFLALRWSIGHYRIGQMVRRAEQAPGAIRDECLRVARAVGCPNGVDVRQSALVESPLVCGFLRPVLLLPPRMCEDAYREDVPAILAHEMTHVRFHDLAWNTALNLLAIALWVHPLAWRVRRAHLAACELVCDGVSADFVGSVADYCRTLARVAVESVTASSAAGIAMARTSSVSRRLAALRRKVFHKPLRGRSVVGFGLAVLVGVGALGALRFAMAASEPEGAAASAAKPEAEAAKGEKQPAAATDTPPKSGSMLVRVVDEAGKPLGGTQVTVFSSPGLGDRASCTTDAEGKATVIVPALDAKYYSIAAKPEGYPLLIKRWRDVGGNEPIPGEFTFTFENGRTIGGVVRDEQGKPIRGARVDLGISSQKYAQSGMALDPSVTLIETDAAGQWHFDHVPQGIDWIEVGLQHPDFMVERSHVLSDTEKQAVENRTAVMMMRKGILVSGTVTGQDGKPVAGAKVILGERNSMWPSVSTDAMGQYRFANLAPGGALLAVISPGLAPALRSLNVQPGMGAVDFQLEKGKTLRVKVVGKDGRSLAGVFASPGSWRVQRDLRDIGVSGKTDQEGRWTWTWAPSDAVEMNLSRSGFMSRSKLALVPRESEHVVTLSEALTISGKVIDAKTKQPVPSFHVIYGRRQEGISDPRVFWDRQGAVAAANGEYKQVISEPQLAHWVRIEADGYRPAVSRELKNDDGSVTCDFALGKGQDLSATVLLPDGKPATGAEVRLCPEPQGKAFNEMLTVRNGRVSSSNRGSSTLTTGPDGRVDLDPQDNPFVLFVLHDQGFAQVTNQQLAADPRITLTAWARLEGVVRQGTKPAPGAKLSATYAEQPIDPHRSFLRFEDNAVADRDGKFAFTRLRPGRVSVSEVRSVPDVDAAARKNAQPGLHVQAWRVEAIPSVRKTFDLAPAQTLNVKLGGAGRPVIGRIVWPQGEPPENGDLSRLSATVSSKPPESPSPPKAILDQGPDAVRAWLTQWNQSEEGKAWRTRSAEQERMPPWLRASIDRSGVLRIEYAVPGPYWLHVRVALQEDIFPWEQTRWANYRCEFAVPDIPGGVSDEPLDLGNLALQGEAPRELPAAPVTPPAPLGAGEKRVGGLREQAELLRYVASTHRENKARIRTWQGQATLDHRNMSYRLAVGGEYSAKIQFAFDRTRKSVWWNTTLDRLAHIRGGVKTPQPVPQVSNGMQTPEGLYRLESVGMFVDPAKRPLTLVIHPTDETSDARNRLRLYYEFNPLFFTETPDRDVARDISSYLRSADDPERATTKVTREGDDVTIDMAIDMGGNEFVDRLTVSLAQGCNPIRYAVGWAQPDGPTRQYRWTYELRDGIWLPKTWTERHHSEGSLDVENKVTFVENRVNQPVEPEAFSLSRLGLKPGDNVDDRRTGQKYQYEGK
ncbi:MAG: carboxypeptidase regulatory-like domain-containing protein [Pirellulales bacterium]